MRYIRLELANRPSKLIAFIGNYKTRLNIIFLIYIVEAVYREIVGLVRLIREEVEGNIEYLIICYSSIYIEKRYAKLIRLIRRV